MYFALVNYPQITHEDFQSFRQRYDPYVNLIAEHLTFIFPVPEDVGRIKLEEHIVKVLRTWEPFKVHFSTLELNWDHWMYLGAKEGHERIVELHDQLYEGILSPFLREDLPFYPHIGVGLFSKEGYDFNNPTAKLTLDEEKYKQARKEFEAIGFDLWITVDSLSLVKVNSDYTECNDIRSFMIQNS